MTKCTSSTRRQASPPEQTEFPTGAKRVEKTRDARYDLLCPSAVREYARVCALGAKVYGPRNWEKGLPTSNYIDHAMEHLTEFMRDASLEHLSHALWNVAAAIHNYTECQHSLAFMDEKEVG